jgi:(p)ppGpp synthase/HD superfamily hydrolase
MKLCYEAHENQYDRGGIPYVFHPFHLAEQLEEERAVCVALLHDVVEDTDYTLDDIKKMGFPEEVISAVSCLTRPKGMPYTEYINIVATNTLATRVKLLDLEHNMDTTRLDSVDEDVNKRIKKYEKAKSVLLDILN